MSWRRFALALCLALSLIPPALARSPLDDPRAHGLVPVAEGIWAEASLPGVDRDALVHLVSDARARVEHYYGALAGHPNIAFCASDRCYTRLGAHGLGFSDGQHVLIAPRGRRAAIVAHELAHVELATRLGGMDQVLHRVPQWFDEGLAVMISGAEEFSEHAWRDATENGRHAPSLDALADLPTWHRLTGEQGEGMQLTYGTAGHEVRRWTDLSGHAAPDQLTRALRDGEAFTTAYRRLASAPPPPGGFAARAAQGWDSANAAPGFSAQTMRDTRSAE